MTEPLDLKSSRARIFELESRLRALREDYEQLWAECRKRGDERDRLLEECANKADWLHRMKDENESLRDERARLQATIERALEVADG